MLPAKPDPKPIVLQLLGRFAASVADSPPRLITLSGPRHRALLAYLAMRPSHAETRERLATLLWSERPDKQARQNLRQLLLTLREQLKAAGTDPLLIAKDSIGLDPALVRVDALAFLAQVGAAPLAVGAPAGLPEYGPFLDGVNVDSDAFNEWARGEHARLESAAVVIFRQSAEWHDQGGHGVQAMIAAERLVALDPLREDGQRLLLRLSARYEGRAAALAHAERLRQLLRDELAAQPEPETEALIAQIRAAPAALAPSRPISVRAAHAAARPDRPAVPRVAEGPIEATAQPPESARPPRPTLVRWALVGAAAAAVTAILLLPREHTTPVRAAATSPTDASKPPDWTWRSPNVLPNVQAQTPATTARGLSALVVLPFTSDAPETSPGRRLADRITDDLINDLSRAPGLRVIARQTSRLYAGRPVDAAAVGAELGVRYVVEGSVRFEGDVLRVNVALIDPATRLQVWSDRFERERVDRPALQDEITRGLSRRLQISVVGAEDRRRAPTLGAGRDGIDDLLAKGWAAVTRINEADKTSGAATYFEEVLKRDPGNVSGLTGLAASKVQAVTMFLVADPKPLMAEAEEMLDRAIRKDPWATFPYFYLGMLEKTRARPNAALAHFAKVLELNPSYAPAHAQVGHVLSRIGRLNEALEHVRYAIRLSPKDHNVGLWSLFGGQIELERGDDAAALEWLTRARDATPRNPFLRASMAAAHALRGEDAKAAEHAAETRKLAPWLTPDLMVERLTGLSAPGAEPRRLIEGLRKAFPSAE